MNQPTAIYTDNNAWIYCADNVEFMATIPNEVIHLTVTSPPYDQQRDYTKKSEWNWKKFCKVARQLYRITVKGGVVVWVVNDQTLDGSETCSSFMQAVYFTKACGFLLHDTMIWRKPHFANPSRNRYHQVFEYMFVFSKGSPRVFNPIKDLPVKYGKPWGKTSLRKKSGEVVNGEQQEKVTSEGMRHNVWEMNTVGQEEPGVEQKHPAAFPYTLAENHIKSWSQENDIVFDPFLGRGTTLISACRLKRKGVGVDESIEYTHLAKENLIKALSL